MILSEAILPSKQPCSLTGVRLSSGGVPNRDLGPYVMIKMGGENVMYVRQADFSAFAQMVEQANGRLAFP